MRRRLIGAAVRAAQIRLGRRRVFYHQREKLMIDGSDLGPCPACGSRRVIRHQIPVKHGRTLSGPVLTEIQTFYRCAGCGRPIRLETEERQPGLRRGAR